MRMKVTQREREKKMGRPAWTESCDSPPAPCTDGRTEVNLHCHPHGCVEAGERREEGNRGEQTSAYIIYLDVQQRKGREGEGNMHAFRDPRMPLQQQGKRASQQENLRLVSKHANGWGRMEGESPPPRPCFRGLSLSLPLPFSACVAGVDLKKRKRKRRDTDERERAV
mmetsp:Transcript_173/g.417  ORF Transcript_173/g.417 Transcript_173/m.417 type:complete len:168 (-) Transcript_173:1343-1846(-)